MVNWSQILCIQLRISLVNHLYKYNDYNSYVVLKAFILHVN